MKLYLSSYKLGNEVESLKEWIKNNGNKILMIPNARDAKIQNEEEKEKIKNNVKILEKIGFKVKILDLKKYFNNKEKLFNDIKEYNAFCSIGGNVFVLRQAMKLSGFDEYLINNYQKNKKLYIGYSAGSCVLAKNLDGLQLVDNPINPYNNEEITFEGIGLIDYCIAPHYKSNHKESELIDNVISYLEEKQLKYKAIKDGEVIKINFD